MAQVVHASERDEAGACVDDGAARAPGRLDAATPAEFAAALTAADIVRAERAVARLLAGPQVAAVGASADDFVSDAIVATLAGRRTWKIGVPLWVHLRDAAVVRARRQLADAARQASLATAEDPDEHGGAEDGVAEDGGPRAVRCVGGVTDTREQADPAAVRRRLDAEIADDPDLVAMLDAIDAGVRTEAGLARWLGSSRQAARNTRARLVRVGRRVVRQLRLAS